MPTTATNFVRTASLILDCQYGSTGKGLLAGFIASVTMPDTIAYAPSPNAGHTLIWEDSVFIHKMLPTGFTSPKLRSIILGPGSLLDLDLLLVELRSLRMRVEQTRYMSILIHENAAVVLQRHRDAEADGGTAPGSTRQGVGAAQIERIRRGVASTNLVHFNLSHPVFQEQGVQVVNTAEMQLEYLTSSRLQIESCQGYGLSIFHGQYPHTTSRDVTTASILADVGAPWGLNPDIYGSFRTYPIRVANRPQHGEHSGPCYPDSAEITFDAIGQQQELTTVTRLPRRIFTWSQRQAEEACLQNRVQFGFLNFAQYPPSYEELYSIWSRLSKLTMVRYLGFGPTIEDVYKVSTPEISRHHIEEVYEQYR